MLEWRNLGRDKFERATAALIRRRHRPGTDFDDQVLVPDARSGDNGIDILARDGEETWLYQQKYFPEGFSGGFRDTRRDQIRSSFKQAMKLKPRPDYWVLLVPRDLTLDERDWLNRLPNSVKKGKKPLVRSFGPSELDELLARNLDIEDFINRDATREALNLVGGALADSAMVSSVEGYTDRICAVNAAADTMDPDWTTRSTIDSSGSESVAIVPKHGNPRPIVFSLEINKEALAPENRTLFEDVIGYGLPGELVVNTPPGKSIYQDAPAFLLSSHDPTCSYQWKIASNSREPDPLEGQRVELTLEFPHRRSASHLLTITQVTRGAFGTAIHLKLTDICTLRFRLPKPQSTNTLTGQGRLEVIIEMGNSLPEEIITAMDLQADLYACIKLSLGVPGNPLTMEREADESERPEQEEYRLLMEDLMVIQRETHQKFIAPEEMTERERTLIRFLRLLLEGHVVPVPGLRRIQVTLHEDRLNPIDPAMRGEAFSCLLTQEPYTLRTLGRDLTVPGPVYTYHPKAELEPIEGLDTRVATHNKAHIRPLDDEYFVAYRPDRVRSAPLAPTPWGLNGIDEQKTYTPADVQ